MCHMCLLPVFNRRHLRIKCILLKIYKRMILIKNLRDNNYKPISILDRKCTMSKLFKHKNWYYSVESCCKLNFTFCSKQETLQQLNQVHSKYNNCFCGAYQRLLSLEGYHWPDQSLSHHKHTDPVLVRLTWNILCCFFL